MVSVERMKCLVAITVLHACAFGSAQRFSYRSSLDFGGGGGGGDQTWSATFGPRGDAAIRLAQYPVYALPVASGVPMAGPEQGSWQINGSYGNLAARGRCVLSDGTMGDCAPVILSGVSSFSSGNGAPWVSSATYALTGIPQPSAPTTLVSNTTYQGEWTQVDLPSPRRVSQYTLSPGSARQYPRSHVLAGSNDGVAWFSVGRVVSAARPPNVGALASSFSVSSRTAFSKYRLVVTRVSQNAASASAGLTLLEAPGSVWLDPPVAGDAVPTASDPYSPPTVTTFGLPGPIPAFSNFAAAFAAYTEASGPSTISLASRTWTSPTLVEGYSATLAEFRVPDGTPPSTANMAGTNAVVFLFDVTANQETAALIQGHAYRALIVAGNSAAVSLFARCSASLCPGMQAAQLSARRTETPFAPSSVAAPTLPAACNAPLFSVSA